MASVSLRFVAPDVEDLVSLHILESTSATGPFTEIQTVTSIGTYPAYIDHFTTTLATSALHWFAVQWENAGGVRTEVSAAIQGGTESLVWRIVSRARQRDPGISEPVVAQEAEAAIETYFGADPYTIDPDTVSYRVLSGLTYLALARALAVSITTAAAAATAAGDIASWQVGLVNSKTSTTTGGSNTGTTSVNANLESLIDLANELLGWHVSLVMLLEDVNVTGSRSAAMWQDQSRLVVETEIQ
jgi:hypothetical protein